MSQVMDDLYYDAAAHHEAGHALAAVAVGAVEIVVSLEPYPVCRGKTSFAYGTTKLDPARDEKIIRNLILIAVAGHVAEQIFWASVPKGRRPASIQNFQGDMDEAQRLAELMADDGVSLDAIIDEAFARAQEFLLAELQNVIVLARILFKRRTLDDAAIRTLVPKSGLMPL